MALEFFLGANAPGGFVSLFEGLAREGLALYAVKGGPGCGKATLIRRLADDLGGAEEWIRCASDPDSLDGAIVGGAAILDGTAPHIQEPAFPGCNGDYLPLPSCLPGLDAHREALWALQAGAKAEYAGATRLLEAALRVRQERREICRSLLSGPGIEKRAAGLLRQLPRGGSGQIRRRFLEGVTPKGYLTLTETLSQFSTVIALRDSCGLSEELLQQLLTSAVQRGLTVYACHDPLEPERLTHLLLPEAGVAFARVTEEAAFPVTRTIRAESGLDREGLRQHKGRLRLLKTLEEGLIADAAGHLATAHALHDRMEEIYRPYLDIPALEQAYPALLARIRT